MGTQNSLRTEQFRDLKHVGRNISSLLQKGIVILTTGQYLHWFDVAKITFKCAYHMKFFIPNFVVWGRRQLIKLFMLSNKGRFLKKGILFLVFPTSLSLWNISEQKPSSEGDYFFVLCSNSLNCTISSKMLVFIWLI